MAQSWRENLKSGPLGNLYLIVRNLKRSIRKEPLAGTVHVAQTHLSVEELLRSVTSFSSHSRYYYALALSYLSTELSGAIIESPSSDIHAHRRALACLRCAEALDFESPERIAVYKSWIYARFGDIETARDLINTIDTFDLERERSMIQAILGGSVSPLGQSTISSPPAVEAVLATWDQAPPQSLIVFGDTAALSSLWLPTSRYLLVEPQVTGLDPEASAGLGIHFDVAWGPQVLLHQARAAGLQCSEWIASPEWS